MTALTLPPRWEHQTNGLDFIRDLPGAMLAMEMGCGKTRCAIDHLEELEAYRTIILCPLSIVDHVWPEQIDIYSTRRILSVPLGNRYDSVQAKLQRAQIMLAAPNNPAVLIVNFESCWRAPLGPWLLSQKWDLLIVDESHRLKTPSGKASLWASKLADRVPRRLALTGTPMPHSPLDIYAQYRIVDKSVYGTNYQAFKDRYAVMSDILVRKRVPQDQGKDNTTSDPEFTAVSKVTDFKDLDHLERLFSSRAFRVTADEALDLPDIVRTYHKVSLSPPAQRAYIQMETEFIAELQSGETLTAPNVLAKLLRLQQFTSGYAPTKEGGTYNLDQSKSTALKDILNAIPPQEPVVVFARFHHDLDEINKVATACDRLTFELSGRTKEFGEWKQQGGVLAVQIQAGGLGISLIEARYCVYYSLGFNLGDYLQSQARVHRPGQLRRVQYIHILAKDTIDITVMYSLAKKLNVVSSILEQRSLKKTEPPQDDLQPRHPKQRVEPVFWITNPPPRESNRTLSKNLTRRPTIEQYRTGPPLHQVNPGKTADGNPPQRGKETPDRHAGKGR